ncbi:uncharacterized protein [Miscanthus floridulus]|uniref:uncharacterized protein n=1 Tax=Miscanthus floridulus TaxID=154761 RepID=UPI0034591736
MHGEAEWLRSSLKAAEVALSAAHRERVAAQAQLAALREQLVAERRNAGRHLVDAVTSRRERRVLEDRQLMLQGLINQRNEDLVTLYGAIGVACNAVSRAEEHGNPTEVKERLRAMPVRVTRVVSHGVRVGTTRALAVAQLRFGDAVDLRQADRGFPPQSSRTTIESLVADFGAAGHAILAAVDVERILLSALDEE